MNSRRRKTQAERLLADVRRRRTLYLAQQAAGRPVPDGCDRVLAACEQALAVLVEHQQEKKT